MSSGPLAPDQNFLLRGREKYFTIGLEAVRKLVQGKTHLCIDEENVSINALELFTRDKEGEPSSGGKGLQVTVNRLLNEIVNRQKM